MSVNRLIITTRMTNMSEKSRSWDTVVACKGLQCDEKNCQRNLCVEGIHEYRTQICRLAAAIHAITLPTRGSMTIKAMTVVPALLLVVL